MLFPPQQLCFTTFLLMLTHLCLLASACAGVVISTDKNTYSPGETIRVFFDQAPGNDRDWICIVPSRALENEAGDYQYLAQGSTRGELTFTAPVSGQYEARAYYNYRSNGYHATARSSFVVSDGRQDSAATLSKKSTPVHTDHTGSNSLLRTATGMSGHAYKMVGGTLKEIGAQQGDSTTGKFLADVGTFHTSVGETLEQSAQNNTGVGETFVSVNKTAYGAIQNIGGHKSNHGVARANSSNRMSQQTIIMSVQKQLMNEGYYEGKADGVIGGKTVEALKNYQHDNKLQVTGEADPATLALMGIPHPL